MYIIFNKLTHSSNYIIVWFLRKIIVYLKFCQNVEHRVMHIQTLKTFYTHCNHGVHELFEKTAALYPNHIAVTYENEQLNYKQLNEQSNQLAHFLKRKGVTIGTKVAINLNKSINLIIAILGILKAGGVYIPLDPIYPKERLNRILLDVDPEFLITQKTYDHLFDEFDKPHRKLILENELPFIAKELCDNLNIKIKPESLAYIIYTSGSTGNPNGVMIEHRGVARLFLKQEKLYHFTCDDVWTLSHSYAFDFSVWEIWGALFHGAKLVIVPNCFLHSPDKFFNLMIEQNVTILNKTPTAYEQLLNYQLNHQKTVPDLKITKLRTVFIGGEHWKENLVDLHIQCFPKTRLFNQYGPTECTVWATSARIYCPILGRKKLSIGYPIANTQVYLLDDNQQAVPFGMVGELYIGGEGVARGYFNRPELTKAKFIPKKLNDTLSDKLYKTGDLCRYQEDGSLEFISRVDNQIKFHGFRIEPGEIETLLCQHPMIKQAVVDLKENVKTNNKQLIAYIVKNEKKTITISDNYIQNNCIQQKNRSQLDNRIQLEQENIKKWQTIYDAIYDQPCPTQDPTFNILGWHDSHTGKLIASEQMKEWVDCTVQRILDLKPKRVLEIGCGTGLLLLRLAPHCESYYGTDISFKALDYLNTIIKKEQLTTVTPITLEKSAAHECLENSPVLFDTVILNSVIQYFPSKEYLYQVLKTVVKQVKPGGTIFIGDVINFTLKNLFQPSNESQLLIKPSFFTDLTQEISDITHVDVLLKRGHFLNEMTKFRYDVILKVGPVDPINSLKESKPFEWYDWSPEHWSLTNIKQFILDKKPNIFGLSNIKNARLNHDHDTRLNHEQNEAIDPEQLWSININNHHLNKAVENYKVTLSCFNDYSDGSYDAIFERVTPNDKLFSYLNTKNKKRLVNESVEYEYANEPLEYELNQQIITELNNSLRNKLPDYMIPSSFVFLKNIPLTLNGKIDRKLLKTIEQETRQTNNFYVPPQTAVEIQLSQIWAELLGITNPGLYDNFFELGGNSLLGVSLISKIKKRFSIDIPYYSLFESPTLTQLTRIITVLLNN